jgi:hypothetical protein
MLIAMCLPLMAEQRTASEAYTAINNVINDAVNVSVNVNGRTINVAGASKVAIYNTAGSLVGSNAVTQLPAGVYIVVADGNCFKVVVR